MRAVIQRVSRAAVRVDQQVVAGEIQQGLLILIGIGKEDDFTSCVQMAKKIANLRIFSDSAGKMNLSILDIHGQAIVVSQFTLYADTRKGNRPSFVNARDPQEASILVENFVEQLGLLGVPVEKGIFAADMQVELINDGPVTIWLEV